jgi:hypothetical protein
LAFGSLLLGRGLRLLAQGCLPWAMDRSVRPPPRMVSFRACTTNPPRGVWSQGHHSKSQAWVCVCVGADGCGARPTPWIVELQLLLAWLHRDFAHRSTSSHLVDSKKGGQWSFGGTGGPKPRDKKRLNRKPLGESTIGFLSGDFCGTRLQSATWR